MSKGLRIRALAAPGFRLDGGAMFGVVPKVLWEKNYTVDEMNRIQLTTRCILLESGSLKCIIDPGIGLAWDDDFIQRHAIGETPAEAVLIPGPDTLTPEPAPESVTDVFLTHVHFDHLGGCFTRSVQDGLTLRFPQARHHVQLRQWQWAMAPSLKDRGSYIAEYLALLKSSGCLELHDGPWSPLPGVTAFIVNGHTPAQQLCRIEAGGGTYVYGGDLFPLAPMLKLPWIMAYDLDPLATLDAKQTCLREQLSHGEILILGHDPGCFGGKIDFTGKYPQLIPVHAH